MCYERPVSAPNVAIDVTPLIGIRTGIGHAVAATTAALMAGVDPPVLLPYALSLHARDHRVHLPETTRFPLIPARVALRAWTRADHPRIDRWIRGADVLHATNYLAPPSRLPTVVTIHDCAFVRYPELVTPEMRAVEPVIRRAVDRGAVIHTPSQFVAHEVDEIFGPGLTRARRVRVIPWGVPPVLRDLGLSAPIESAIAGRPFVLSMAALEPRKNLPHLVAAFGHFATVVTDHVLVLAGPDGSATRAVEEAVRRLGPHARERVVRIGAVDDRDRSALLHRAAALAYPSISEGFGFPVLEAMIAGTPVVAARAGSIPEIAGDAAELVDATDETTLAARLADVLAPERRADLVARGRVVAERFSWERTAAALVELYRELA